MHTAIPWSAVVLLASLPMITGCQSTGAESATAGTGGGPASTVTAMEQPDRETTFPEIPGAVPPPAEFATTPQLGEIHFAFDAYEIRPEDVAVLDANVSWLRANPGALVLIEGHADERGTAEYNLALGERRAGAVMSYLIERGVRATRLVSISYGKERPICTEHDETCWARNRRAVFLVKSLR